MRTTRLVAFLLAIIWGCNSVFGGGGVGLCPAPALAQAPGASQPPRQAWSLTVARDVRGTLWAAWEVDDGQDAEIYAARWTDKGWSDVAPVSARPEAWDRTPSLAMSADGTVWLAWSSTLKDSLNKTRIYFRRWSAGRWSNAESLPEGTAFDACPSCGRATEPALAAASDGTMWVAWVGSDSREDNIFAQRWNGGVWSLPRQVSADDGSPLLYDRQPQLAVGEDGRPWIAWTGNQAGSDGIPIPGDDEIYASHWTGATWAPEEMVSRDDVALDTAPALALDGQGQPWIAWQARVTEEGVSRLRILASRRDASRGVWTLEGMASSPLTANIDETRPSLAPDSGGVMQVAWVGQSGDEPALGYTRRGQTGWNAPSLVASGARNGISGGGAARLVPGEGSATLLWLDPLPGTLLPVERFEVPLEEKNSLATWLAAQPMDVRAVTVDPYPYRFLAFGDSITWGLYPVDDPFYPYPSILQDTLRLRAHSQYNVVNSGVSGERTDDGMNRIKLEVAEYKPQYVLIMEGTNDVSHEIPPSEVYDNLLLMLANVTQYSGVVGVKPMLATIIPRLDDRLEATQLMNELAIIPAADAKHVPLADQWQAFMSYGDWPSIMWDTKHPNQVGLELIANTFYARILQAWSTTVTEETVPPTTWVEPLPATSSCSGFVVAWNGTDNLNWVVSYDVQVQVNLGTWTDWLLGTSERSAVYPGGRGGDQIGFRVRGRDLVGNLSDYSTPVYTTIADDVAPQAEMLPMQFVQTLPFAVSWRGSDVCGSVVGYHIQYRVGGSLTWIDWFLSTPLTSATFNPVAPSYGESVYFRVQARDEAGNWSAWSPEVSTLLARYTLGGQVLNIRHEPVAGATTSTSPTALAIVPQSPGRFLAFLENGGDYDVTAQRDLVFGSLPPMRNVAVSANVAGLIFALPPQDDAVLNGGFEVGGLDNWILGGTLLPTLSTEAHTGSSAAKLDGTGGNASLVQVVSPTDGVTQAYLSLLARLEPSTGTNTLQIMLSNEGSPEPPVIHELPLVSDTWIHAWYDLGDLQAGPVTVALVVSGMPAILVDEVSLGTALSGGSWSYLPVVFKR